MYSLFSTTLHSKSHFIFILSLGLIFETIGCQSNSSTVSTQTPSVVSDTMQSRTSFLMHFVDHLYTPLIDSLEDHLTSLKMKNQAWQLYLDEQTSQGGWNEMDTQSLDKLKSVQKQWSLVMGIAQSLEVIQVGGAGAQDLRIGGQDLRERLYSYPLHSPCRVDQEVLKNEFQQDQWAKDTSFNVRGLDALETLLFSQSTDNHCPPEAQMNRGGMWNAWIAEDESKSLTRVLLRRAEYASVLIQDALDGVTLLKTQWMKSSTPDFESSFGAALTQGTSPFSSTQEGLNEVFAALFYLDQMIKDQKVGIPLGVDMECMEDRCFEGIEHSLSKGSHWALSMNLNILGMVMFGGNWDDEALMVHDLDASEDLSDWSGATHPFPQLIETLRVHRETIGFDDLLIEAGADDLAEQLYQEWVSAWNTLHSTSLPLKEWILESPDQAEQFHTHLKKINQLIKTQMVTVLNLSVPQEGAGDND